MKRGRSGIAIGSTSSPTKTVSRSLSSAIATGRRVGDVAAQVPRHGFRLTDCRQRALAWMLLQSLDDANRAESGVEEGTVQCLARGPTFPRPADE
jgi:hypothetical protein